MIDDDMCLLMYDFCHTCKDCPYYYDKIDQCMFGEEDAPYDLKKKCEEGELK